MEYNNKTYSFLIGMNVFFYSHPFGSKDFHRGLHGGVVVGKRVPGSILDWGPSVWSLHVLPVYTWVLSGYCGFIPKTCMSG